MQPTGWWDVHSEFRSIEAKVSCTLTITISLHSHPISCHPFIYYSSLFALFSFSSYPPWERVVFTIYFHGKFKWTKIVAEKQKASLMAFIALYSLVYAYRWEVPAPESDIRDRFAVSLRIHVGRDDVGGACQMQPTSLCADQH
jgi:hypothetical protein